MLTELRNCGVQDAFIVCCDGLKGLPDSIRATWPLTEVQPGRERSGVGARPTSTWPEEAVVRRAVLAGAVVVLLGAVLVGVTVVRGSGDDCGAALGGESDDLPATVPAAGAGAAVVRDDVVDAAQREATVASVAGSPGFGDVRWAAPADVGSVVAVHGGYAVLADDGDPDDDRVLVGVYDASGVVRWARVLDRDGIPEIGFEAGGTAVVVSWNMGVGDGRALEMVVLDAEDGSVSSCHRFAGGKSFVGENAVDIDQVAGVAVVETQGTLHVVPAGGVSSWDVPGVGQSQVVTGSSVVVAYTWFPDERDPGRVAVFDATDGTPLWELAPVPAEWTAGGATVVVTVEVADGIVVVSARGRDSDVQSFLAAYDARSGALLWRLDGVVRGGGDTVRVFGAAVVLGTLPDRCGPDAVLCVVAVDIQTGEQRWAAEAVTGEDAVAIGAGLVLLDWGLWDVVDPATGALLESEIVAGYQTNDQAVGDTTAALAYTGGPLVVYDLAGDAS